MHKRKVVNRMYDFVLAIDLETTGLDPLENEITQVGALLLDKHLEEISSYESLVKPRWPERGIKDGFNVFEYTGLSQTVLNRERSPKKVLDELELWLISYAAPLYPTEVPSRFLLKNIVLMGQNVMFDANMLTFEYARQHKSYPFAHHTLNLESLFFALRYKKTGLLPKKLALKDICDFLGVTNSKAHDAMSDIRATVECARECLL